MSRQRLNVLLDEAQVERVRQGREALVNLPDAQAAVQRAAATGRVRTPKKEPASDMQESVAILKEQLAARDAKLEELSDQLKGYEAMKLEMRLLKGEVERKAAEIERRDSEAAKHKPGFFSRVDKAIQTIRGETL
jgi:hypothetical protein